jgi:DNA (cytosine-5)-methyltransferase 1
MALEEVYFDLEGIGYEVRAFIIPACSVNAPHVRKRIWICANSNSGGQQPKLPIRESDSGRMEAKVKRVGEPWLCDPWALEPGVCRVVDGVPNRVDRLRSLGNAVVPQQAYPIFAAIAETYNDEVQQRHDQAEPKRPS